MRISQDRYTRDRLRYDLAVRMMWHGARARTISSWTGLTADRQRKLYRSYLMHWPAGANARRRRGKSPRQHAFFLQTAELSLEASMLAAMFYLQGLLQEKILVSQSSVPPQLPAIAPDQATLFCAIYEDYLHRFPSARITFEYAWFLLRCLIERLLQLVVCKKCHRLYVRDGQCLEETHCGCSAGLPKHHRHSRLPKALLRAISAAPPAP